MRHGPPLLSQNQEEHLGPSLGHNSHTGHLGTVIRATANTNLSELIGEMVSNGEMRGE